MLSTSQSRNSGVRVLLQSGFVFTFLNFSGNLLLGTKFRTKLEQQFVGFRTK